MRVQWGAALAMWRSPVCSKKEKQVLLYARMQPCPARDED
jgi:hypothetical protein